MQVDLKEFNLKLVLKCNKVFVDGRIDTDSFVEEIVIDMLVVLDG